MAFVVCDPALVGDQASHQRAGPQGRREAVSFGAFEQQRRQALARRGVDPSTLWSGDVRRRRTLEGPSGSGRGYIAAAHCADALDERL